MLEVERGDGSEVCDRSIDVPCELGIAEGREVLPLQRKVLLEHERALFVIPTIDLRTPRLCRKRALGDGLEREGLIPIGRPR